MKETNCLEKNPCVEKYYSGLTKEQRLAEIDDSLRSARKIVRNLEKQRNKLVNSMILR